MDDHSEIQENMLFRQSSENQAVTQLKNRNTVPNVKFHSRFHSQSPEDLNLIQFDDDFSFLHGESSLEEKKVNYSQIKPNIKQRNWIFFFVCCSIILNIILVLYFLQPGKTTAECNKLDFPSETLEEYEAVFVSENSLELCSNDSHKCHHTNAGYVNDWKEMGGNIAQLLTGSKFRLNCSGLFKLCIEANLLAPNHFDAGDTYGVALAVANETIGQCMFVLHRGNRTKLQWFPGNGNGVCKESVDIHQLHADSSGFGVRNKARIVFTTESRFAKDDQIRFVFFSNYFQFAVVKIILSSYV